MTTLKSDTILLNIINSSKLYEEVFNRYCFKCERKTKIFSNKIFKFDNDYKLKLYCPYCGGFAYVSAKKFMNHFIDLEDI